MKKPEIDRKTVNKFKKDATYHLMKESNKSSGDIEKEFKEVCTLFYKTAHEIGQKCGASISKKRVD